MKTKSGTIFILALGIICLSTGLALAQANGGANVGKSTFADNPSPFPFVHLGVGGTGTLLSGGQLITTTGSITGTDFFLQEFVNIDGQLAIHSILANGPATTNGPVFIQEDFVMMGQQRSPTNQNNTTTPVLPAPSHTNIAFRQSVTDSGFSTTSSLDPGEQIHVHQQVGASAVALPGQTGGLTFTNVDILPNAATNPNDQSPISCGTAVFCTTLAQEVKQPDNSFTQTITFTTGPNAQPVIVQNP